MHFIPVDFNLLADNYPFRIQKVGNFGGGLKDPDLRKLMARNPGTPCCVQVSHAMNMAGLLIPKTYPHCRRPNDGMKLKGVTYYYLRACDEMEIYLTYAYGAGELVRNKPISDPPLPRATRERAILSNRQGILVMREGPFGIHAELWTGKSFLQTDMAVDHLLQRPRVLFWQTYGEARWLYEYMKTQPRGTPYGPSR